MKTRILLLCVVLVGLCGSIALALDPMGPPKANLQKGLWSIGVEHSYSDMDIRRKGGYPGDMGLKYMRAKVKVQKTYANIGYGLSDNVVGFFRLGLGSGDFDRGTASDTSIEWEGNGDTEFIWGGGFKATLSQDDSVSWGILAQYSWGTYGGTQKRKSNGNKRDYDITMNELQIAVGPTFSITDDIQLYGGPFLHYIDGEYKEDGSDPEDHVYKTIEQKTEFGGYVGLCVDLNANTIINIEYQDTGDAWAIAGGITFRF